MADPEHRCPDDGACHHDCSADECFRVRHCVPLSDYGEEWTPEDLKRFGKLLRKPRIDDVIADA